ncbi:MAG: MurR/RpiR family transcriptional regulator [Roseitalea sp.]|jgi:RpiR family carbohydrate utilization transcriptional regulator|nr:MurR/RpiR family transcriptional regulator [Roseitalea sp.]MBO6720435.1 MurR/RpiR family transcriptional regulator [Roseitalea sp.]MBO6742795.1 MurR/RpiR family transcriptional regulator [Roseitalea sp.]
MELREPDVQSGRNILEVTRTLRANLRKSDRKVADVLLESPQRILNATVAETAELADVSQPTVIRFCAAIGCEGFQDLKIRLAQSLALGTPATHSAITDDDTPAAVASKIFDYTISSLDWARHALDMEQMNAAVALILKATHLEFFGFGASAIVAQDLQQKFPLFGIPCNATMDSHQQLMAASMMKPGSVAVAISNTGQTLSIVELARLAREQGAKVISIAGSTQTALFDYSDVVINVETLDNTDIFTPTTSRIAALVAADILSTLVARQLGTPHNQRLVRMKRYLSQMRRNEAF